MPDERPEPDPDPAHADPERTEPEASGPERPDPARPDPGRPPVAPAEDRAEDRVDDTGNDTTCDPPVEAAPTEASERAPLELRVEHAARLCFAQQQAGLALVQAVEVRNHGDAPLRGARLVLELGRGWVEPVVRPLADLPPGRSIRLTDVRLEPAPEALRARDERERVTLTVRLERPREAGELFEEPPQEVLARHTAPVDVLATREWPGLAVRPELLAGFVRPNRPEVGSLLREAAGLLEAETGDPGLHGTARGAARVRETVRALWRALAGQELGYVVPAASFEQDGQKVRLVEDLVRERMGTCLDLALLFAAMLEQAGLRPLLVVVEGHALAGVWLGDDGFAPVDEDGLALRKRVELDEVWLLETTGVTARPPMDLEEARARGAATLDDLGRFRVVVDVHAARERGVRPLALGDAAPGEPPPGAVLHLEGTADRGALARPPAPRAPDATGTPAAPGAALAPDPGPPPSEPGAPGSPGSPGSPGAPESRLDRWRRRLLDLTLRNRLIAFRETLRTLPLEVPDLAALEDALSDGASFALEPRLEDESDPSGSTAAPDGGSDYDRESRRRDRLAADFGRGRLHARLTPEALEKRGLTTWREARNALEETGAGTLYLTLGMLTWFEEGDPDTPRRAPILLVPAVLERQGVREGYRLRAGDEEPTLNVTLLEKLRADFRVEDPALAECVEDEHGLDVPAILRRWRRAVRDRPGWEVRDEAWLGHFSFTKFLLWRDLGERTEDLKQSPLVRHLIETPEQAFRPGVPLPSAEELDSRPTSEVACPTDADSSQRAAVRAALEGHTFVLQGPPGTGKSQTITNLIAGALQRGQRVLFVAEKRAALEVVQRRLERVGLAPRVLELHSSKASKRQVLEQLREALEAPRPAEPAAWESTCAELDATRDELNALVEALHRVHPVGRSLFDVVAEQEAFRDAPPVPLALPEDATADWLEGVRAAAASLVQAGEEVEPVAGHPLTGVGLDDWSTDLERRLAERGEALEAAARATGEALDDLAAALSVGGPTESAGGADGPAARVSGADLERLARAVELVLRAPARPAALLTEPDWRATLEALHAELERARTLRADRARLLEHWDPALLQADLDGLAAALRAGKDRFLFLSWFACRAPRATLRGLRRGPLPDNEGLVRDLDEARRLRDEERSVADPAGRAARLLGADWVRPERDLDAAAADLEWADALRGALRELDGSDGPLAGGGVSPTWTEALGDLATERRDDLDPAARPGRALRAWLGRQEALAGARAETVDALCLDPDALPAPELPAGLRLLGERARGWVDAAPRLRPWTAWRRARAAAAAAGLAGPLAALEAGEVARRDLPRAIERTWRRDWLRRTVDADPRLRNFHASEQAHRVRRFADLDAEVMDLVRRVTAARLAARVPSARQASSDASELGRLQRELRKKTRHLPVRRLVAELPTLLPRLKPCFLMSPLSVAQYLDPALERFDLVVFDEASQIPVWDAVGALARGQAAVVVGDSQQLPPTTFFQRGADEDEPDEDDLDELESILDEAVAAQVPSLSLRWHYRSRHEDLITFSNVHYYDGSLFTFPAAGGAPPTGPSRPGVHALAVPDGVYERGGKRWNRAEAEAVAAEVVRRLREEPERTLGVVTFSMAQQTLVEDLLEAELRADPSLEPWFSPEREEPVFVKNLENVQGDERDVILFSVCYGPDPGGRVAMAFGPLNRDGGERRLNVAITRAREEVLVISTLRAEQIDLSRTAAVGAAHLKAYLEYAQRGPASLDVQRLPRPGDDRPTPFEDALAGALRGAGWSVERAVGSSGYRVDLGLRARAPEGGTSEGPEAAPYLLGIECDGVPYRGAGTARDRERTRRAVLERLGWNLVRSWSLDWWLDRENELERLLEHAEAVQRARAADAPPRTSPVPPPPPAVDGTPAEADPDGDASSPARADAPPPPYRPARLRSRSADAFASARTDTLARALLEVVEAEAPVPFELAARRVLAAWGQTVLTRSARARLDEALELLLRDPERRPTRRDDVLWAPGQDPGTWLDWRPPAPDDPDPRELDELPVEERAGLLLSVLRHELGMPEEDLLRAGARAAGLGRLGRRAAEALTLGLGLLLERGLAERADDGRVTLV